MSFKRDVAVAIVGAVVAIGVILIVQFIELRLFDDTETAISLYELGGSCAVTGKDNLLIARRGRRVMFEVQNHCSTRQTVSVGNFRSAQNPPGTSCAAAAAGAEYPFEQPDFQDRSKSVNGTNNPVNPRTGRLNMKLRDATSEDPDEVEYYFDVCVGDAPGAVQNDPRLILKR